MVSFCLFFFSVSRQYSVIIVVFYSNKMHNSDTHIGGPGLRVGEPYFPQMLGIVM